LRHRGGRLGRRSGRRRLACFHHLDGFLPHQRGDAHHAVEDHGALIVTIAAEEACERLAQGIELLAVRGGAFGVQFHENTTAILPITHPARKTFGFEPIDEAGD